MAVDLELATTQQIFEELRSRHDAVLLCVSNGGDSGAGSDEVLWNNNVNTLGLCKLAEMTVKHVVIQDIREAEEETEEQD